MRLNSEMLFLAAHAVVDQKDARTSKQVAKLKRMAAVHPCNNCGKPMGLGHDGVSAGSCEVCWEEAGWENHHLDGSHEQGEMPECCPMCRKAATTCTHCGRDLTEEPVGVCTSDDCPRLDKELDS